MSDKKDEKKEPGFTLEDMTKALAEALAKGQADGIAMASMANKPQAPRVVSRERCGECGQLRAACHDKHIKMVVWPLDSANERFFSGIKVNHIRYRTNDAGHQIPVPAENDIPGELAKWERTEKQIREGRTVQHNSGSIGMGANNFKAFGGSGFGGQ